MVFDIDIVLIPKDKNKVDLHRSDAKWRTDFFRALTAVQVKGTLPNLKGADFANNLEAIHVLPIKDQQEAMNHAIAYLRAETLLKDLRKGCVNDAKLVYSIETTWGNNSQTRQAAVVDISVEQVVPLTDDTGWGPWLQLPSNIGSE